MGTKMSKKPKVIDYIRPRHYDALVRKVLKYPRLRPSRYPYDVYSMTDLRFFLDETLPCLTQGDPALQLLNIERAWHATFKKKALSTFGYVYGDLRLPEEANTSRICSQNFYIDWTRTIWLIDPKTGRVYQPPSTIEAHLIIL